MLIGSTYFRGGRRGRSTSTVAVLVALFCLAGQILTAAHEATERHVVCAEHGELSHVRVAPGAAIERTRADHSADAQDLSVEAAHDHCAIAVFARRSVDQPILSVSRVPEPPAMPAPVSPPVLRSQTDRILLTAPKTAPPAC